MDLLAKADPEQRRLMAEQCILLDQADAPIGHASKKDCHLKTAESTKGMLHRAFSVFLFNDKFELLLQKRSQAKVTFPGLWTNTCCSHPLFVADEMEEEDGMGTRRAAQRRMGYELGVDPADLGPEDFRYLTRIHYQADSDDNWAEHEIDYILFAKKAIPFEANKNEVENTTYISRERLAEWMKEEPAAFTPWFKLIAARFLDKWWKQMHDSDSGSVSAVEGDGMLHEM